jgi:hypothetical protein
MLSRVDIVILEMHLEKWKIFFEAITTTLSSSSSSSTTTTTTTLPATTAVTTQKRSLLGTPKLVVCSFSLFCFQSSQNQTSDDCNF